MIVGRKFYRVSSSFSYEVNWTLILSVVCVLAVAGIVVIILSPMAGKFIDNEQLIQGFSENRCLALLEEKGFPAKQLRFSGNRLNYHFDRPAAGSVLWKVAYEGKELSSSGLFGQLPVHEKNYFTVTSDEFEGCGVKIIKQGNPTVNQVVTESYSCALPEDNITYVFWHQNFGDYAVFSFDSFFERSGSSEYAIYYFNQTNISLEGLKRVHTMVGNALCSEL